MWKVELQQYLKILLGFQNKNGPNIPCFMNEISTVGQFHEAYIVPSNPAQGQVHYINIPWPYIMEVKF